jgi:hypothetical protein
MRKRDGRPFTSVSIIIEREPQKAGSLTKEQATFLKINDINDI